jgi:hypothetical protein
MGYWDNFPAVSGKLVSAFGQTVTYKPIEGGIADFDCEVVLGEIEYDDPITNAVRDLLECHVLHSDLQTAGKSSPTVYSERSIGDQIAIDDPTGTPVNWQVIQKRHEAGIWVLVLEKNIRIVP